MTSFQTITISSLSEFTSLLEKRITDKYRVTLFRGQPVDKALIPSIARHIYKKSREVDELNMLDEFSSLSVQYLNHIPKNKLEELTIAQHYGLPTRLLDWTENALAALFFAVSKKSADDEQSVVWVLSLDRNSKLLLKDSNIDIFKQKQVLFFKPASIIPRVTSQFGWFSIHPYEGGGFYSRVDRKYKDSTRVNKILIEKGKEVEILKTLESCGVNKYSIFRDLDSLGSYIFEKYKYEKDNPRVKI